MKLNKFDFLFFVIVILNFIGLWYSPAISMIVKPLIMASLILWYVTKMKKDQRTIVLIGMLFALIGDITLLFAGINLFFTFGLLAFIIMQTCYSYFFKKYYEAPKGRKLVLSVLIFVSIVLFNIFYWSYFKDFKFLISIYSISISIMAFFGVNQKLSEKISIGSLIFIVSFFLLATFKFAAQIWTLPYLILITYALAKYYMANGIGEEADVWASIRSKQAAQKSKKTK
jgi:uncharacterized membrane protein YhhN